MAEARQTLKIFISYARRDAGAFAEELLHGLEVAGFEALFELERERLRQQGRLQRRVGIAVRRSARH